jgi:hypothetical protein
MIMPRIEAILPAAIEIAFDMMLIIDNITATVHAHPRPFSSPQATTNEAMAIASSTTPNAMPIHPIKD